MNNKCCRYYQKIDCPISSPKGWIKFLSEEIYILENKRKDIPIFFISSIAFLLSLISIVLPNPIFLPDRIITIIISFGGVIGTFLILALLNYRTIFKYRNLRSNIINGKFYNIYDIRDEWNKIRDRPI